jgi:hypothetical protein
MGNILIGMFLLHRSDNCRADIYVHSGRKCVFYNEAASRRLMYNAVPQWLDFDVDKQESLLVPSTEVVVLTG